MWLPRARAPGRLAGGFFTVTRVGDRPHAVVRCQEAIDLGAKRRVVAAGAVQQCRSCGRRQAHGPIEQRTDFRGVDHVVRGARCVRWAVSINPSLVLTTDRRPETALVVRGLAGENVYCIGTFARSSSNQFRTRLTCVTAGTAGPRTDCVT
jgi:hypothetical protein